MSQANQLLGASYQRYRNSKTNHTIIRTVAYSLPAVLHTRIRTVAPTTYFPFTRGMRQTPPRRSFEAAQAQAAPEKLVTTRQVPGITPSVLRWLYKTDGYTPAAINRNKLGILGVGHEYPSEDDLTSFMARYRSTEDTAFTVVQWNSGGYNPGNPSDGANIGVQYAAGIAYPTPLVFYSIGGNMTWNLYGGMPLAGDVYREWFRHILELPDLPQTISISYGHSEQDLPVDYARALCDLFMELAARGVTVLVASGMDGVGAGDCVNRQGNVQFIPEFPSSCTCDIIIRSRRQKGAMPSHSQDRHDLQVPLSPALAVL